MFKQIAVVFLMATCSAQTAAQSFSTWPTGTYRYVSTKPDALSTLLLRKSGSAVIGVELFNRRELPAVRYCFRGEAKGDRIERITRIAPPYTPASTWESGQELDLTELSVLPYEMTVLSLAEQTALEDCLSLFWR
ncbi:hypothetical protein S7335_4313 [Synechococcus sp. PCC 7335]|nr:hypothetical protein S7335_4313 [Synechococcus sp. PCC 7335]